MNFAAEQFGENPLHGTYAAKISAELDEQAAHRQYLDALIAAKELEAKQFRALARTRSIGAIDMEYQIRYGFQSTTEAERCMNYPINHLKAYLYSRIWCHGLYWYYVDDPQPPRPCKNGIIYWGLFKFYSIKSLALIMPRTVVEQGLKRGRLKGIPIRIERPDPQKILEIIHLDKPARFG